MPWKEWVRVTDESRLGAALPAPDSTLPRLHKTSARLIVVEYHVNPTVPPGFAALPCELIASAFQQTRGATL